MDIKDPKFRIKLYKLLDKLRENREKSLKCLRECFSDSLKSDAPPAEQQVLNSTDTPAPDGSYSVGSYSFRPTGPNGIDYVLVRKK
jgi:hypothetical protein